MRLVIDLQGAQSTSRWRGIGRYSLALAETMARMRGEHEIVIVLSDAFPETLVPLRSRLEPLVGAENVKVWSAPMPVRGDGPENTDRRVRAEAILDAFLASLDPDIIFVSSFFEGYGDNALTSVKRLDLGVPVAATLYDLIPLHDPGRYLKPFRAWERFYYEKLKALPRADLLLAISEFAAADAAQHVGAGECRIVNISSACSDIFRPSQMPQEARASLRERLGIDRPYIVTSGTVEPRKNLSTLFAAFAGLPDNVRDSHQIVLVGRATESERAIYRKMLASAGLPENVLIVTDYVTDDDLIALYSDAKLMVFPSTDEGFGLPALEAMSCGAPTIASNATSLPEVMGLVEAQFDPRDTEGLTALIERGLQDNAFRDTLLNNARERAAAFSWEKTARAALTAMENLVAERVAPPRSGRHPIESCLDALAASAPSRSEMDALVRALAFDFPEPGRKPQLFVDVSELRERDARTGCQRVTRNVLQAWLKTPPEGFTIVPVYATTEKSGYYYAYEFLAKLTGEPRRGPDALIDYAPGDVFFGLDLAPAIVSAQRGYLQHMRRRGVRTRFLVFDLLPVQMPQHCDTGIVSAFEAWLKTLLVSDGIVGISRTTVDAFRAWQLDHGFESEGPFGYDHVHLGADLEISLPTTGFPDDAQHVLARLGERRTFLSVGTVEPRKGYTQTLDAFDKLWARGVDVNLVLVGKQGWHVDALVERLRGHIENGRRLFWLEGISDEYLGKVYSGATCLLAASEGEGFGLPLIEAAQAGLPVLARDIGVFREVAGAHASYFDAKTSNHLADAVEDWLLAHREGRAPTSEGLEWRTWAECAAELGRIITECRPLQIRIRSLATGV